MQELEKILEEIDENKHIVEIFGRGVYFVPLEATKQIILKHINDDWIPVEERLPERNKTVLACQSGGAIESAWHDGDRWKTGFSHADWLKDVVAWRPLPEPYRQHAEHERLMEIGKELAEGISRGVREVEAGMNEKD